MSLVTATSSVTSSCSRPGSVEHRPEVPLLARLWDPDPGPERHLTFPAVAELRAVHLRD